MSWNYRVMRTTDPDGTFVFSIYEVYYDAEGFPNAWTAEPVGVHGATYRELTRDLSRYQNALSKHVIAIEANGDELRDVGPMGTNKTKPGQGQLIWKRETAASRPSPEAAKEPK